jgi:RNA polymerase sigma-70 factor (ECF subfamily)
MSPPPLDALKDEALVGRALAGEGRAFALLVGRHERALFRFLSRTSANGADVEDAMQAAFVKAHAKLGTYNPAYRFNTWLFTIALRELRSIGRRGAGLRTTTLDAAAQAAAPEPVDGEPGELWRLARRVLTTPQYTALWLRHGEDLPPREIARVMRRPRIWVSVTLHRACAVLRKSVGSGDGEAREAAVRTGGGG